MRTSVTEYLLIALFLTFSMASKTFAQAPQGVNAEQERALENAPPTPYNWQMGVYTGPLLPHSIPYVRDLLPFWGLKIGHDTRFGRFEYDVLMALAKGVTYYLGYFSLRNDFNVANAFGIHSLFGFDYSYYKPKPTEITQTPHDWVKRGGWHIGAGDEFDISRTLMARADFRLGFGPGRTFNLNMGFMYKF